MKFKFLLILLLTSCVSELNKTISKSTYASSGFAYIYNESDYINYQDWSADTDIKKELMEKYFPERFGPEEVQDLEIEVRKGIKKYGPGEIGKIFDSLVGFYKKRQEEN